MTARIAVVIPNWNGLDYLAECLDSLAAQTIVVHTIVVDNGSADGSMELVRDGYPNIELISLSENAGFAGGVNLGIASALARDFEYVALLNNDAAAEPDWAEHLVEGLIARPDAGMVTSKIRRSDGDLLDSTGDYYSIWGFPYPRGRDEVDRGQYDEQTEVFGCSGGATAYRTDMLRRIGLFDERFFAYYEDVDISFRAQLAGWKAVYAPGAVVHHHLGGTSSKISGFAQYHMAKNFVYLYVKNMPGRLFWRYLWRVGLSFLMLGVSHLRHGVFRAYLKGAATALVHLPAVIRDRRRIQRSRTVSIGYIDALLMREMPPTQRAYWALMARLRPGLRPRDGDDLA